MSVVGVLKDDILLDFDFFHSDSFCQVRRWEKTLGLPLVPADTLPGLAEQTSLLGPLFLRSWPPGSAGYISGWS